MNNSFQSFKSLLRYTLPWRFRLCVASLYSVVNKLFDLAPEILIGVAVDLVVKKQDSFVAGLGFTSTYSQIVFLAVATFFIWAFESIFQYLYMISWRGIAQDVEHTVRLDAYSHVQNLDMNWYENQHIGNITAILNDDVNQLERFLDSGANDIIQIIVSSLVVGIIFFYISPIIGFISLMPIPIILFIAFIFQKSLSPKYLEVRNFAGILSSTIFNNLLGIQTIKSFNQEKTEYNRIKSLSKNYQVKNKTAIKVSSAFVPIVRMGVLSGFLGTMIIGGFKALNGDIAVGSFSVLVFLTQRFLWPFTRLGEMVDQFERAMASTHRILSLIKTKNRIIDRIDPIVLKNYFLPIQFKNIDFKYESSDLIFKKLNLKINPKEFTGIVGTTGSGKTTLAKMLLRFFDPLNGDIKIGNNNISDISIYNLRKNIGFVSQEIFLFDGSIKENITYSKKNYDEEKMLISSKKSQAHQFIINLKDGYDTQIGERGQKLSVGQKQRIAIARAIYKDPPILIFDEATSSLDNETERLIQNAILEVSKGRTTIAIAHRLSTIRNADRILVIDDCKIKEDGNHEKLINIKNGYYKRLWQIQTGEKKY
ncbi:MAG: ABC transporter [Candidatus Marinimicrobia bacterium]|nr:ABC transporter [Candidatus Neomarinimicrobiota bacterium]|tara:strand:+ start:632 stop:2410 length:1779 start_codon:yes stop_codon:yes gene_type:complete